MRSVDIYRKEEAYLMLICQSGFILAGTARRAAFQLQHEVNIKHLLEQMMRKELNSASAAREGKLNKMKAPAITL